MNLYEKNCLSYEDVIQLATQRVLPAGYKPEDYLAVSETAPFKLAKMIVDEARHIIFISNKWMAMFPKGVSF